VADLAGLLKMFPCLSLRDIIPMGLPETNQ
jgi:hypothetical protein